MKLIISSFFILLFLTGCAQQSSQVQNQSSFSQPTTTQKPLNYQDYKVGLLNHVRGADYNGEYANTNHIYQNLNGAIVAIADQLLITNVKKQMKTSLILTSFVDLEQFNKTTTFGRLISESMFNELHIRKFKVTDFRGQDAVVVNADGEFHITRDTDKLKDQVETVEYIVVGTYSRFENESILVNVRIIDSISGEVISSARIIYKPHDCSLFDLCSQTKELEKINIITDNCSKVGCPTQQCTSGICDNSATY